MLGRKLTCNNSTAILAACFDDGDFGRAPGVADGVRDLAMSILRGTMVSWCVWMYFKLIFPERGG